MTAPTPDRPPAPRTEPESTALDRAPVDRPPSAAEVLAATEHRIEDLLAVVERRGAAPAPLRADDRARELAAIAAGLQAAVRDVEEHARRLSVLLAAPSVPSPSPAPRSSEDGDGDGDGARLTALAMAAEGRSREEVQRHLGETLGLRGYEAVLEEVFGAPSRACPEPARTDRRHGRSRRPRRT